METQARYEDLSKYYFSVLLAKEVVETRQLVESGLKTHRDNALKLEQQGQIARVERLQAESALDQATIERKKAQRILISHRQRSLRYSANLRRLSHAIIYLSTTLFPQWTHSLTKL